MDPQSCDISTNFTYDGGLRNSRYNSKLLKNIYPSGFKVKPKEKHFLQLLTNESSIDSFEKFATHSFMSWTRGDSFSDSVTVDLSDCVDPYADVAGPIYRSNAIKDSIPPYFKDSTINNLDSLHSKSLKLNKRVSKIKKLKDEMVRTFILYCAY